MDTLDIVLLIILLIGSLSACWRGFFHSITRFSGFIIAIPVALIMTYDVASFIRNSEFLHVGIFVSTLLAFVLSAIAVYIACSLVGFLLSGIADTNPITSAINSILGFAWGLVFTALILFIVLSIALRFQSIAKYTETSYIVNNLLMPIFSKLTLTAKEALNGI